MTRSILASLLVVLALALGLGTSIVQVQNCARATQLSDLVRETEMLECVVGMLESECQAYIHPLLQQVELTPEIDELPGELPGELPDELPGGELLQLSVDSGPALLEVHE